MRYDQYYLVNRLSENLSEEGEEDFPHIGQIRFSNGSDKKNNANKLIFLGGRGGPHPQKKFVHIIFLLILDPTQQNCVTSIINKKTNMNKLFFWPQNKYLFAFIFIDIGSHKKYPPS